MRFLMLVVADPDVDTSEEPVLTIEEWSTETSESGINLDGDRLRPPEQAKTVRRRGGKVFVTDLGLPSEMRGYVKSGVSKSFALWNPIDLGYAAVQLAVAAAKGTSVGPNTTVPAGRVGQIAFNAEGVGDMGKPFVFNAANIDGPEASY